MEESPEHYWNKPEHIISFLSIHIWGRLGPLIGLLQTPSSLFADRLPLVPHMSENMMVPTCELWRACPDMHRVIVLYNWKCGHWQFYVPDSQPKSTGFHGEFTVVASASWVNRPSASVIRAHYERRREDLLNTAWRSGSAAVIWGGVNGFLAQESHYRWYFLEEQP